MVLKGEKNKKEKGEKRVRTAEVLGVILEFVEVDDPLLALGAALVGFELEFPAADEHDSAEIFVARGLGNEGFANLARGAQNESSQLSFTLHHN